MVIKSLLLRTLFLFQKKIFIIVCVAVTVVILILIIALSIALSWYPAAKPKVLTLFLQL